MIWAAMLAHNTDSALLMLSDLFALKTEPIQILSAIIYNADKLMETKILAQDGADKSQIMSKLKISPFAATKFLKDSAKYSIESLRHLCRRLAETDGQIKSNSMDNNVLLSMLVAELSSLR